MVYRHFSRRPNIMLLILVFCTALGPLSIDLFVPSLPTISTSFATSPATAQWTISIFMLGFAVSMLIVGPLADRFGRKNVLITGYIVYLLATAAILVTEHIWAFITARFFQAVFGCFGTALSRTIVRDLYDGKQEVRMIALIGGCMAIAPAIAPIIGGTLAELFGWQANFILMLIIGTLLMAIVWLFVPETYTAQPETPVKTNLCQRFLAVLADRHYCFYTLMAAVAFSGVFVFIAAAPFVFIDHLGFSTRQFSYCVAIMITGYVLGSLFASRAIERLGIQRVLYITFGMMAAGASLAFITGLGFVTDTLQGNQAVAGYVLGMFLYELGMGIFIPACQTTALRNIKNNIGTASGLIFFVEMALAAPVCYLAGQLPHTSTFPLSSVSVAAVLIIGLMLLGYRNKGFAQASAPVATTV
ncbi:multidrug effflux MFS transporter [Endozoicomonas sp. SM1973]|uniref:Bcr/CflA family efflux transporter n=1 Tax=Spartinivicinus marinus TaxID=2994442 RepID=A0A853I5V2_9GAMM|nr:multidrug effflux MFS transporter [Spartinivicinus marinus]MCX4029382.1 multidrug effflux MFS transporter [Spartinivicinus marinus]NYZ64957.1 multidrug effflux MFS transporter [Spartinivicinus marinus]